MSFNIANISDVFPHPSSVMLLFTFVLGSGDVAERVLAWQSPSYYPERSGRFRHRVCGVDGAGYANQACKETNRWHRLLTTRAHLYASLPRRPVYIFG